MKIHHIGYLVKNISEALTKFGKLGFVQTTDITLDVIRRINICFIEKDKYTVELISPLDNDSPFYGLLKKYRNSPYHICYLSDCFENDMNSLLADGYMLFQPPLEAPAISGRKVCFLMNTEIGMIELLENEMEPKHETV